MALCVEASSDNFLYVNELSLDECSSFVLVTVGEYKETLFEFNPSEVSTLFLFAFGVVLLSYKSGWVVSVVKTIIGKI